MQDCLTTRPPVEDLGSTVVSDGEWLLYAPALSGTLALGLPMALGGGLAFSAYSRRCRFTKDIDLYIRPEDRQVFIDELGKAGFKDYFDRCPYDRQWIYRGYQDDVIIDLIWAMANYRASVDDSWFVHARPFRLRGLNLPLLPPEELVWAKLYVMQRDRCDWPDLLNVLRGEGPNLDWERLIGRLEGDDRVLAGLLCLFEWMCPEEARALPGWIWARLGIAAPPAGADLRERVDLLDRRDWFGEKVLPAGGRAC